MVNMKINKGNMEIELNGTLPDLTAELLMGIRAVHKKIKSADEDSGEMFEALLMMGLFKIFNPEEGDELLQKLRKAVEEDDDEDEDEDDDVLDDIIKLLTKVRDAK